MSLYKYGVDDKHIDPEKTEVGNSKKPELKKKKEKITKKVEEENARHKTM